MSLNSMMSKKVKEINKGKLNKLASDIAKRNNKSASYVKRDMVNNFIKYGIGYTDYLKGDYINLTTERSIPAEPGRGRSGWKGNRKWEYQYS